MTSALAQRHFVRDLSLVESVSALTIEASLARVTADEKLQTVEARSHRLEGDDEFWGDPDDAYMAYIRPYVVQDGILYIPVRGVLLCDFPFAYGNWATGFQYIGRAVKRGMADPAVRGIVFLISSGGGTVQECFDCAQFIYDQRGTKPMVAVACDFAYSAAYMIASAADKVMVARTGGVGSIGVVTMHADMSKMLDDIGIKVTFIFAGEHKVDGNPYEALPADVKARIEARVEHTYDIFTSDVARNRGMTTAAVRATQALTYGSDDAVSVGLADGIANVEDAVAAFVASIDNPPDPPPADPDDEDEDEDEDPTMSTKPADTNASTVDASAVRTAERTRISAIMNSEGAKRNPAQANHLAHNTDMSAEDAIAVLALNPEPAKGDQSGDAGKGAADSQKGGDPAADAKTDQGLPAPGTKARADGYKAMNGGTGSPKVKEGRGDDAGASGEGGETTRDPFASLARMRGWQNGQS